jgi:hypothetical protein
MIENLTVIKLDIFTSYTENKTKEVWQHVAG